MTVYYNPTEFHFNRKYLYYAERKASPLQFDDVVEEIAEWFKHLPPSPLFEEENYVRPAAPLFSNIDDYENLQDQLISNCFAVDENSSDYISKFLTQYISAFLVCKNYTDDELSYLYTVCFENADYGKYSDGANFLASDCKYLQSRLKVMYIIAYNMFFALYMVIENCNKLDMGKSFDLLKYVGEEMPEEDYRKEQEEYEEWRSKEIERIKNRFNH